MHLASHPLKALAVSATLLALKTPATPTTPTTPPTPGAALSGG